MYNVQRDGYDTNSDHLERNNRNMNDCFVNKGHVRPQNVSHTAGFIQGSTSHDLIRHFKGSDFYETSNQKRRKSANDSYTLHAKSWKRTKQKRSSDSSYIQRNPRSSFQFHKRYTLQPTPNYDNGSTTSIPDGGSVVSFTLQDVWHQRVTYRHDGSETLLDSMMLQLQLIAQLGYILPSYLQVGFIIIHCFLTYYIDQIIQFSKLVN